MDAPGDPAGTDPGGPKDDPDAALKDAIAAAVAAGQYERAAKLLDVLRATVPAASIVDLAARRRG